MALKPWYKIITPREDLRKGKPLDASEFAVHLDQIREGRAPDVYQNPQQFFERTYLTQNLSTLAIEVLRRLAGQKTETSAVFNMSTQFGGGKTHSLTLLYHLARLGAEANKLPGVEHLLVQAKLNNVPKAATAVFVGTEFDSIAGRGGDDGTPLRKTPWGEIAWLLGGEAAFNHVAEHDAQGDAPGGDVIRRFLPQNQPCLILLDELMNYVSRSRKMGMGSQLYNFLQNLSEVARGSDNIVLAVSIPASELEMNTEDQSDFNRFKKLLDRVGKAIMMSAESETAEIIRRRLFEWEDIGYSHVEGRPIVALPPEARKICQAYQESVLKNKNFLPDWFVTGDALKTFESTYPFHPLVLSVFERKWQALPRFQQTRGVLRLLALWVSHAYVQGTQGDNKDPLIVLGTAPLENTMFRAALFEQLGEQRLEAAVTTDIKGKAESHALRLDETSDIPEIKKGRLHQKTATAIFFESNGGQTQHRATRPEITLSLVEPDLDIGHIETLLEDLSESCYYLTVEKNQYKFSLYPNLNKLLADRKASVQPANIQNLITQEIQKVFSQGSGVERIYFPVKSGQIADRPAITLVIVSPEQAQQNNLDQWIDALTRENGNSARTYKSALIWCLPDPNQGLNEDARKLLAWQTIQEESYELRLDDLQTRQLNENLSKAKRDLTESVWRSYKTLVYLDKNTELKTVDLGLVHSSSAKNLLQYIVDRLKQDGDIEESISPNFLMRNWPPAFKEWSTRNLRDAFFASPRFPRLLNPESLKSSIQMGVKNGILAYVGKNADDKYVPFEFNTTLSLSDIEISDDMFVISRDTAEEYLEKQRKPENKPVHEPKPEPLPKLDSQTKIKVIDSNQNEDPFSRSASQNEETNENSIEKITRIHWSSEIELRRWPQFFQKVLLKISKQAGLKVQITLDLVNEAGISEHEIEEIQMGLQDLDLPYKLDKN